MNIAEFHQQAASAFKGAWFKVSIEQYSTESAPRFAVYVSDGEDGGARGEGLIPAEAIRKCRQKLAQQRAEKIEAARKLLDSIG